MGLRSTETVENIFQPNNHSKWVIKFHDVDLDVSQKISRLIFTHYERIVSEVLSVQQFDGTEINSHNYKVQFKNCYDQVLTILMRVHKTFDSEFILTVIQVCEYLHQKGCKVPDAIRNDQGSYITEFEGEKYTAYIFVTGTHYQGNGNELLSVASELAHLDYQLLTIGNTNIDTSIFNKPDAERDSLEAFSREVWNDITGRAKSRIASGDGDYFDSTIIESSGYIFEAIDLAQSTEDFSPTQLTHSDLHPHNVITDGHALLTFIDFDSLRFWERMRAVSFAIHRLSLQYLVKNNIAQSGRRDVIMFAKDAFLHTYDKINRLSRKEAASVGYFIQDEALRRATWVANSFYLKGIESWKLGIYKQLRSILEAKYFLDA